MDILERVLLFVIIVWAAAATVDTFEGTGVYHAGLPNYYPAETPRLR